MRGHYKRGLGNVQEQPDRLESIHDRVRQAAVEVIDEDNHGRHAVQVVQQVRELSAERCYGHGQFRVLAVFGRTVVIAHGTGQRGGPLLELPNHFPRCRVDEPCPNCGSGWPEPGGRCASRPQHSIGEPAQPPDLSLLLLCGLGSLGLQPVQDGRHQRGLHIVMALALPWAEGHDDVAGLLVLQLLLGQPEQAALARSPIAQQSERQRQQALLGQRHNHLVDQKLKAQKIDVRLVISQWLWLLFTPQAPAPLRNAREVSRILGSGTDSSAAAGLQNCDRTSARQLVAAIHTVSGLASGPMAWGQDIVSQSSTMRRCVSSGTWLEMATAGSTIWAFMRSCRNTAMAANGKVGVKC